MNYQQKVYDLLNNPSLSHKLKVKFALLCTEIVVQLLTDKRSIKSLKYTILWLQDKATQKQIEVASKAGDAALKCSTLKYYSICYISSCPAAVALNPKTSTNVAYNCFKASSVMKNDYGKEYYNKLIKMIKEEKNE